MKPSTFTSLFVAASVLFAATLYPASAGIIRRANSNAGSLTATNSWLGAVVPGSGDIALWDFAVSTGANCTNGLGSSTNWAGIAVRNPNTTVVITNVSPYVLTLGAAGIDLSLASTNLVVGSPMALAAPQTWIVDTAHAIVVSNTVSFGTNTLTVEPFGTGQVVLQASATGTGGLTMGGTGTLNLTNTQAYTGATTVAAGTLTVDFTELGGDNLINPSSTLTLAGGTMNILSSSGPDNQTFNGLALGEGGATFNPNPNSGALNVTLGAITRTAGGAVDIIPPSTGALNITTPNNISGILGGWATVNGFSDWATNNGNGVVAAYGGYQIMPASGGTTNDNDAVDGSVTALTGPLIANSLKLNSGVGGQLDLAGNTLSLNGPSGGLLDAGASGFTLTDSVGTSFLGAGTNEFIVGVQSGATLNVNVPLVGNGTSGQFTKVGPGTLVLTSSNSFTGTTIVGAGTLTLGSGTVGSLAGNVVLNGGSLDFNRNDAAIISPVGGTITVNSPASAIKNIGTPNGATNIITLAGGTHNMDSIWNSSPGTLVVNSSGTNNLYGSTLLKVNGSGSAMFLNGGTYNLLAEAELNGNSSSSWLYLEGANINANNLNGNNGGLTLFTCSLQLDSGLIHVTTGRVSMQTPNQVLNINGGIFAVDNTSGAGFYGMRLGNNSDASATGGASITVNQTGGLVSLTPTNGSTMPLDLGTEGPNYTDTYNLSGGSLMISNNANLQMGADAGGTVTTTFNQTGGNLWVSGSVQGDQASATALQIFSLTGGICTFNTCNATYLRDTAADPAGTLVNNGGTLAPGGVGAPGKMTITGNFNNANNNAVLALDIAGPYQASTFQSGPTNYDFVSVSGNATLGGMITVNLLNGYTPTAISAFTNLTVTGSSSTINAANLNASLGGYIPVYTNGVRAPGNYLRAIVIGKNLILTNYSAVLAPIASFSPTNSVGTAPLPVQFTDASSGVITNRHWSFGDGTTLNTQSTSFIHTYTNLGVYTVTLTVSTAEGLTSTATGKVSVVTPGGTLTWVGHKSSVWDLTTTNWIDALSNPYKYADGDGVIFDDTSTVTNVTLNFAAGPNTLDFNNSANNYTISGAGSINGATYLNVNSSGTVTLLIANNYLGETTVNGTLQLGNGTIPNCSIDNSSAITDNGALIFDQPDNHTISVPINGSGSLTKAGAGTLTLSTDNSSTFFGSVNINGGVLAAADYTGFGTTSTLNLSGGGIAQFTAGPTSYSYTLNLGAGGGGLGNAVTIPSMGTSINGTGPFTKAGSGLMVFDQPPVYTGNTIVTGGSLQLDTGGTSVALPGSVALNGGSLIYERSDTFAQAGVISGNSASSSINNASTGSGNTNTLTFADGNNNFNNLQNSSYGELVLAGSPNSTNNLTGWAWTSSAGSWLSFAGGTYVLNGNTLNSGGSASAGISIDGASVYALGGGGNYWGVGTYPSTSLTINSGLLYVEGRLNMNALNQTLTINGGELVVTNNPSGGNYGFRFGNVNGSSDTSSGGSVSGLQTNGTVLVSSSNGAQFGSAVSSQTVSYTLTGGTFLTAGGQSLTLGASTDGSSTTTFNLDGGELVVSGTLSGAQITGTPQQVLSFQGGTLAVYNCVATYLTDVAGNPLGNLVNYGGVLAPGDLGTVGETIITGNYTVNSSTAALDIDLGGTAPANAFQNTSNYDTVAISGNAILAGNLNLNEINGFEPIVGQNDSFTILTAANITGAFANVASGSRLAVTGYPNRSFRVTVTATNVVLDQYQTTTPQSYFTYNPASGTTPFTVTFTNLSNGAGLTNLWNFGDGGTSVSTAATVNHTYTVVQTNTVSLTVGSALGVNMFTVSNAVVVMPGVPPQIGSLKVSGSNLVLTGTGSPGAGFTVLSSTNLASPRSQWITNATGTFGANGNVTNTIPMNGSTSQDFYLLRSP